MPSAALPGEREFLTVPEVAEQLGVTAGTVRAWLHSGRLVGYLPAGRKGGWRVRPRDLEAFIEASKNVPPPLETA